MAVIDTTNRNMALASALVEELARSGVRDAVLSPGSRSTPVALALDRESSVGLRIVLDERAAGFVAVGIALASGRPVVVACTSGSAAANLHPAVVEADQAGVPLVILTSDRPPELRGIGAGQTIDQVKLYGSAVRWFCEVGTHDADDAGLLHYRSLACRAHAQAKDARGPVHLNLAWRDPLGPEPCPEDLIATDPLAVRGRGERRPLTAAIGTRTADTDVVSAVVEAIDRAARPMIVAGRSPWSDPLSALPALAQRAAAPILAEPTSQLRYGPHDRAAVIAAYDLIIRDLPSGLCPDLVIRIGDMPTSKPLRQWLGSAGAPDQIVIDPPGGWNEPTQRAGAFLRTDAAALTASLSQATRPGDEAWLTAWTVAEAEAQAAIDEVLDQEPGLTEPGLLRALGRRLTDGDRLLLGSSMPVRDAEAFMPGGAARALFFSNRGANGIDGLVSTASGISRGSQGCTWAVLGDLALAHDVGGLATLADADGSVRLLVIDNGGGRIFEFLPQAEQLERERFERLFVTPSGLDLERVADVFGLDYLRIETLRELADEPPRGHSLLHAELEAGNNVQLHSRIAAAVAGRLAR